MKPDAAPAVGGEVAERKELDRAVAVIEQMADKLTLQGGTLVQCSVVLKSLEVLVRHCKKGE